MNILIIDPSKSYRTIIKQILSSDEVSVVEAVSGAEALAYLKQNKPTAISMAYELGDMNSQQLLKKLSLNTVLQNIPKFLLTSNVSNELKRDAYDFGFTEIFLKSDFANLKRALKSLLLVTTTNVKANVLYIEDTQSTADYTSHIMTSAGWSVTHVKSGEEAIVKLDKATQTFDLVVTDLVLDGQISGIALINIIRQGNRATRDLPILAVSGWNDLLRQVYVLRHGAGDFIAKPFHETDFLARAINLIQNKRALDKARYNQKALFQKANIDALTQLNNRNFLEDFGIDKVNQAIQKNDGVALMMIDIDYFKQVNDREGHEMGDRVLRQTAIVIKGLCRPDDLAIRYGGDEMMVLMLGVSDAEAKSRAEETRAEIELLTTANGNVTVSVGLACYSQKTEKYLIDVLRSLSEETEEFVLDYQALFRAADHSLFEAKKQGRNRVVSHSKLADC